MSPLSPNAARLMAACDRIFGAQREIADGDTFVFATGTCSQEPRFHSFPDIVEA